MKKYTLHLVGFIITFCFNTHAQKILYSEDFSNVNLNNKGQDGAVLDVSGVTNWTVNLTGAVSMSGSDHFKQTNGVFQSENTDAPENPGVLWYSLQVNISCYTNVTVSTLLSRQSSHSASGVEAFYILNGGTPVSFGSLKGTSGTSPTNATFSGLTGNTIQIVVKHWGTSSTPKYEHDNVLITGVYNTTTCPIVAGPPSCGGYLTDSDAGSSAGNYANNVNFTSTVCPATPGELTTVTFEDLDIGAGDVLKIYAGDNISGSLLGTVNSSTSVGLSVSSYDCITFNWITDGNNSGNKGFWASILCSVPIVNKVATDDFANAPTMCDLSSYSGSTKGNTPDIPFNLKPNGNSTNAIECPSATFKGSVDNNSWLKFVATSTSASINVIPGSCESGFEGGIQMAILAFDGSNFTRLSDCTLSSGGQSSPFTISASPLIIGNIYYIMVDGSAGARCDYTLSMQSGFTPLSVTASPNSVCAGNPVTLTATGVSSSNLIWFANTPNFGSDYGSPLIVNPTATTTYTALDKGGCSGTTGNVTVTVNSCGCNPPVITIAPTSSIICANSNTSFTVAATGGNGQYQWQVNTGGGFVNITNGGVYSGASTATLSITGATAAMSTYQYQCIVKEDVGTCPTTTIPVTLTVNPKPVIAAKTPTICSGSPFTVTPVDGTPSTEVVPVGTTYTWTAPTILPTGAISGGSAQATGQSSISQTLTNTTNASATATYPVTASFGTGTNICTATFNVTVTVNPKPVIAAKTPTICSGSPFTVTPVDGTPSTEVVPAGTTYTWTAPTILPTGAISGGSAQATGQSSISQTLTNTTNASATATYPVTASSGTGTNICTATFNVTVTVNPKPVIAAKTPTICSGSPFTVTPVDGTPSTEVVPAGTTYTWTAPTILPTGAISGGSAQATGQSSISQTLTNTTNASATATYPVTASFGTGTNICTATFNVTVTVNPKPDIAAKTPTICSGSPFTVTPVDGTPSTEVVPAGTTYTWSAPTILPTGAISGGSAQATGQSSISQTLTNTTNASATATYPVTASSGTGTNICTATFNVTVTVNPKPVIAAKTPTICSGSPFTVTPVDGTPSTEVVPAGTTYTWTAPTILPTGAISGGSAQATGQSSISQTLTNTTNASATATYPVTASFGISPNICTSTFNVTVTVNPILVPVVNCGTLTVSSVQFTWLGVTGATSYNASYTIGGVLAPAVTGISSPYSVTGLNVGDQVVIEVMPIGASGTCFAKGTGTCTAQNCTAPSISQQPSATPKCEGSAETLSLVATGGNGYQWQISTDNGVTFTNITGATNASFAISNNTGLNNNQYKVIVKESNNLCPTTSAIVTLTVNPKPIISVKTAITCSDSPFTVTPVDGTPSTELVPAGTTYSWAAPSVTGGITGGVAASTQTNISGTLNNSTNTDQTATYTVTPLSGTCTGATFTVTVTVKPILVPVVNCGTLTVNSVQFTWPGVTEATSYNLSYTIGGVSQPAASVISSPYSVTGLNVGDQVVIEVMPIGASGTCFAKGTGTCTASACTAPNITTQPSATPKCEGSAETLSVVATGGNGYQWQISTDNGVTFTNITGATNASFNIADNTGLNNNQYKVIVKESNNLCPKTSAIVTLIVNPKPNLIITPPAAVCAPLTVDITDPAVTIGSTGADVLSYWSNSLASTTLSNPNNISTTNTYYIKSTTTDGCTDIEAVNVSINNTPSLVISNPPAICAPGTVNLTQAGITAGSTNMGINSYFTDPACTIPVASPTSINTNGTFYIKSLAGNCFDIEPVMVTINPTPTVLIGATASGCAPLKVNLTDPNLTVGSTQGTSFNYWTDNLGTNTLATPSSVSNGIYYITGTLNGCKSSPIQVEVTIHPLPIADFSPTPDLISTLNAETLLKNNSIGGETYFWDFGDGKFSQEVSPYHTYPDIDTATFFPYLIVTSQFGCIDTIVKKVKIYEELAYFIPNTFTPDEDDFNNTFQPVFVSGYDPYNFVMYIYNRWGELIFETHDTKIGWKGTYGSAAEIAKEGVYTWKINFNLKSDDRRKEITGHVNLIK